MEKIILNYVRLIGADMGGKEIVEKLNLSGISCNQDSDYLWMNIVIATSEKGVEEWCDLAANEGGVKSVLIQATDTPMAIKKNIFHSIITFPLRVDTCEEIKLFLQMIKTNLETHWTGSFGLDDFFTLIKGSVCMSSQTYSYASNMSGALCQMEDVWVQKKNRYFLILALKEQKLGIEEGFALDDFSKKFSDAEIFNSNMIPSSENRVTLFTFTPIYPTNVF